MSNDIQKADQIAHRFYTKLTLVVNNARATAEPRSGARVDKWFNLETPDSDMFREHLRTYRAVSMTPPPPSFELQVLLSVPELTNNQVLVYLAPDSSRLRIDPTPRHILLENWLLNFTPEFPQARSGDDQSDVAPSTIYKHGIPLFRSLYSLLRILPSWKLFKKLRRRTTATSRNGNLSIQLRVKGMDDGINDILDFGVSPASNSPPLPFETHEFPPIPHPMGNLRLSAKYLSCPNFQLDELESLLSSRFLSLDEGPEFTPTLVKNQQRDSLSGLPGSVPLRTSLPKSPSIADRFVLPSSHSRTNSMPSSPRQSALPMSRVSVGGMAGGGSTSALSVSSSRQGSSSTWSREEGPPLSGIAARIRRESMQGASRSSADLPASPSPLPIRRPNINPVHPFKASTLSSGSPSLHSPSPSLRQPSPLATGVPSLPSRPVQTSPNSSRVPPSPIGMANRPSPPFAPSSLGDRRSLASAEGDDSSSPKPPQRKRYSSSFGHRYAGSGGAGSDRSGGSRERREGERAGSTSFLGANNDDDEISIFVQEIATRKPLGSIRRSPGGEDGHAAAERTGNDSDGSRRSSIGPMLTTEADVDERLKHMNEMFLASLEGLGGNRRRERRPSADQGDGSSAASSTDGAVARAETSSGRRDERDAGGSRDVSRPRLGSLRSASANDVASSGGSAEVMGRLELDDESWRRRQDRR
ncbi:autophagy-related protein 13-domain-containing protein [Hygrophoropsis aurantiaca]|uniref:Autophagy-related protein 13-domain-containing protein n=1 Tax=Hygrophoropsis aurantiaca TaxID=72124 RepID=A0ACB8ARF5_9AGAM|nr:autophagy-related protein 13-domain-containing protein [Hygrophoropsis aurantiaca]